MSSLVLSHRRQVSLGSYTSPLYLSSVKVSKGPLCKPTGVPPRAPTRTPVVSVSLPSENEGRHVVPARLTPTPGQRTETDPGECGD